MNNIFKINLFQNLSFILSYKIDKRMNNYNKNKNKKLIILIIKFKEYSN